MVREQILLFVVYCLKYLAIKCIILPVAVIMMSAFLTCSASCSGGVFLWHNVVVASNPGISLFLSECNRSAIGKPTFFERPQTTAFLPKVGILLLKIFVICNLNTQFM